MRQLSLSERKFFYSKAIEIIEQGLTVNGIDAYKSTSGTINYYLCRLLPSLAYGLNCGSYQVSEIVMSSSISKYFPEIDIFFINEMAVKAVKGEITVTSANEIRLRKLKEVVNSICNDEKNEQEEIRREIQRAITRIEIDMMLSDLINTKKRPYRFKASLFKYSLVMVVALVFWYIYGLITGL